MANSTYGCTQSELYTTCRNAWLLCQQFLKEFSDYKSKYSVAFITDNLALISSIEAMDDFAARRAPIKELRKSLMAEKSDALTFYVRLKGYVSEAYQGDKTILDANYTEMGQSFYEKLNANSGSDVRSLMSAMVPYVRMHKAELMEKGYMPLSFLTQLEEKKASFDAAHQVWKDEFENKPDATSAKIEANNDLKARVMAMLSDGQAVFCNNKSLAQKFVWSTLLADVRGVKPTGFSGKITDKATEAPLSIVTIFIESLNLTVSCDKNGRYQFVVPTSGKLTLVIKAEGYRTIVLEDQDVKVGVMRRLNIEMERL
ncbi:MAG: carboxypeptidase-like regulatory domain-containing protein [Saprospiraceae bacterium]|nr:carboxypeptidase-like regulatory domain-containing protein [Saprospiraceae bacterium]